MRQQRLAYQDVETTRLEQTWTRWAESPDSFAAFYERSGFVRAGEIFNDDIVATFGDCAAPAHNRSPRALLACAHEGPGRRCQTCAVRR